MSDRSNTALIIVLSLLQQTLTWLFNNEETFVYLHKMKRNYTELINIDIKKIHKLIEDIHDISSWTTKNIVVISKSLSPKVFYGLRSCARLEKLLSGKFCVAIWRQ